MRILFLTEVGDPGVGSSTRQMYQQARRLRELGHETAAVTCVRSPDQAGETEILGMRVFQLYSDYPLRFRALVALRNPRITGPFQRILDEYRPEVVHANLVHTHIGYHALTQASRADAAVVFTAHDVMTFCYQKLTCFHGGPEQRGEQWDVTARLSKCVPCQRLRFLPGRNRRIKKVLARDVDRFTVVSDELGKVIEANGIEVHATVHNAIELGKPVTAEEVASFRERFGLTGCQVLAMGGRLHEQKGVVQLLETVARLAARFPQLRLIVMGRREIYDNEFRARARELGIEDRVVPTDYLSGRDLPTAYAATDVFLTPSICFDTFGLVNLEAMEHAKPVVATTFGGSQEVVEHGRSGFIVNPFHVETMADYVAKLLENPELAQRQGEVGRARLLERFTIERLTDEYLEQYRLAIEARPRAWR